jgi:hypothetical protein
MALEFDGSNDWVDIRAGGPVIDTINGASDCDFMGWFRLDNIGGDNSLIELSVNNGGSPTGTSRWGMEVSGNIDADYAVPDGTTGSAGFSNAVPSGHNHLSLGSHLASDHVHAWINGVVESDTESFAASSFSATGSASGGIMSDPDGGSDEAEGLAEDCRLYNRHLSDAEHETIVVCRGHDGINYGLVNRYVMNEGAPGVVASGAGLVKDRCIGQRNATPNGGPVYAESLLSVRRRFP